MSDLHTAARVARFGKMMPRVTYVDRVVEKVVEKIVEKVVYVEVPLHGPHVCARCREEMTARMPEIASIIRIVARHYNVLPSQICGAVRTQHATRARHIAMYIARKLHPLRSFPELGRMFGGRDHTSVLHGVQKIERLMREDSQFAAEVEAVKSTII